MVSGCGNPGLEILHAGGYACLGEWRKADCFTLPLPGENGRLSTCLECTENVVTGKSMLPIILPVETMARELDAKLLLAAFIAREGGAAIVGSHARINASLHQLPAGCYVSQTIVRAKRRIFRIIHDLQLHLAAWDEEGLVWATPEYYRQRRLDAVNFAMLERFFCWGEQQAEVVRETFPQHAARLRIMGNPRQDLYTPLMRRLHEESRRRIRREYGRFFLVNSNFGSLNPARIPYMGLQKTEEQLKYLAELNRYDINYITFRYRVFLAFCELIPKLAETFPDHNILIRPHPSENPAAWEELAAPLPNVIVRYDHELVPWLLAAEAVIHNGCTTALEAAMLERPVIEYRAVENAMWENPQPSAVSMPARAAEDVVNLLRQPGALERERPQVERALRRMIARWNEGFASERIAKELMRLTREPPPRPTLSRRLAAGVRSRFRAMEKAVVGRLMPWKSANPAYIDRKFPPLPTERVHARLHRLAELAGLPKPEIERLDDRIWRIAPFGGKAT